MSSGLICVDPGKNACGVAIFSGKTLFRAAYVRNAEPSKDGFENACGMARSVFNWAPMFHSDRGVLLVEGQQVYRIGLQKGDPNDLIDLAGVAGAVAAIVAAQKTIRVMPREWKGQVNADVMTARIEGKLSVSDLSKIEKCPASLRHNVIDAIGMGLWYLSR